MSETLVVLVSGRGALAKLAGVPSVLRHVHAARMLGLGVVVVYPPERRALGAEIRGIVEPDALCIPADRFVAEFGFGESTMLLVAAEWYLAIAAVVAIRDASEPVLLGRVCERGCVSVPIARVTREDAVDIALRLGTTSAAAALSGLLVGPEATLDLDAHSEQRLSDNVSTAHAEEKLIETLFGPPQLLPLLRLRPTLAPLLARRFNDTALGPAGISAIKLVIGLAAAWIIESGSYAAGVSGALLYLAARIVGAAGIVLARASFADGDVREKLDLAGDTVLHIALLWSLAGGPARGHGAVALAVVATVGVLVSTGIAYVFVLRDSWLSRQAASQRGERRPGGESASATGDEFVSRFVQRDGVAYALLFAAAAGRLDLFLWAAALASHLFYVLWLITRPRDDGRTMALGKAA
ncbi:MAG TPA: hypothetical protein VGK20_03140 [Candidatus Binatia bacterium]|jgi:hypothetical protein